MKIITDCNQLPAGATPYPQDQQTSIMYEGRKYTKLGESSDKLTGLGILSRVFEIFGRALLSLSIIPLFFKSYTDKFSELADEISTQKEKTIYLKLNDVNVQPSPHWVNQNIQPTPPISIPPIGWVPGVMTSQAQIAANAEADLAKAKAKQDADDKINRYIQIEKQLNSDIELVSKRLANGYSDADLKGKIDQLTTIAEDETKRTGITKTPDEIRQKALLYTKREDEDRLRSYKLKLDMNKTAKEATIILLNAQGAWGA